MANVCVSSKRDKFRISDSKRFRFPRKRIGWEREKKRRKNIENLYFICTIYMYNDPYQFHLRYSICPTLCYTYFVTNQPDSQLLMRASLNDECYTKVFWKYFMHLNLLFRILFYFRFILLIKSNLMKYVGCYSVITLSILHKP